MSSIWDHVVSVAEIPSPRWDLALGQIADGGCMTVLGGEPPVGIQRHVGWPGADGRIHISVFTSREPNSVTREIAQAEVTAGLGQIRAATDADPRLKALFETFGVARSYLYDYGTGAARIGDIADDGTLTLL